MIKIRSPVSEEEVSAFEAEKGIRLPGDYRRFITTVASSGSQPFYGLEPLSQEDCKAYGGGRNGQRSGGEQ